MNINATVSIETITPEQAEILLSNQVDEQRHKRPSYSNRLAIEMVEGRWRLSADAIVLIKGRLANGQHRLTAVTESGIAQEFILLRSNDEELYKILDCGIKRTEADVLPLDNAKRIVSVARLVLRYDKRHKGGKGLLSGANVPRGEILEFCTRNNDALQESSRFAQGLYNKKPVLYVSTGSALHFLLSREWGSEKANTFIESVYDGISNGDAAYEFRERLVKNSLSRAKLDQAHILALGLKAANSWIVNRRIGTLKFLETETYPAILRAA